MPSRPPPRLTKAEPVNGKRHQRPGLTHAIERLEGGEADCLIVTELARPVFSARAEHLAAAKRRILDGEARTIVSVRRAIWVRADASSG